ncbi:hypothetical protein D3C79_958490 [compost metagenome]
MLHHEIRFGKIKHRQRVPGILGRSHQLGFLMGTGIAVVRVTNDEYFPSLESMNEGRVEPLQTGDRQGGVLLGQLQQNLGKRHVSGNHIEARLH